MAAKEVGRPVKLELTRQQMFTGTGHRPATLQTIALAAAKDGKLQAIRHQNENPTSPVGEWIEMSAYGATSALYAAPAIEFGHTIYEVNIAQPSFMRAPGECPDLRFGCAMDELAYALNRSLQLRFDHHSPNHPIKDVPVDETPPRMLSARRGKIRLATTQSRAALDEGWPLAGRMGSRDGDVPGT